MPVMNKRIFIIFLLLMFLSPYFMSGSGSLVMSVEHSASPSVEKDIFEEDDLIGYLKFSYHRVNTAFIQSAHPFFYQPPALPIDQKPPKHTV